jgi:ubiquitin carboxyl-terminal hydrolase 4/11/15
VSKQANTSRIVSSGAYLLFYRRRSDKPLGGPRFQEISDLYSKSRANSDDESDSGEGQRLAGDSSPHGSSSALTGVGAAHQPASGSLGGAQMTRSQGVPIANMIESQTINPADLETPPSYGTHVEDMQLQTSDHNMQDIEDEGVVMEMEDNVFHDVDATRNPPDPDWNFDHLKPSKMRTSGANSMEMNDDNDSDMVAHNSSAGASSIAGRLEEFADAEADEDEWDPRDHVIPDMDEDQEAANVGLRADILDYNDQQEHMGLSTVNVNEVPAEHDLEDDEEEATEIRVEEDEVLGLKMD